jgi:flagellar basal-body rod protein FlgG
MRYIIVGLMLTAVLVLAGCQHAPNPTTARLQSDDNSKTSESGTNEQAIAMMLVKKAMASSHGKDDVTLAYQMLLETIAHNLQNAHTTGFNRIRIDFQEQLDRTVALLTGEANTNLADGLQGVRAVNAKRCFTVGELTQTGERLDLAISGDGFFEVQMPDGTRAYTRDGSFHVNLQGQLCTVNGKLILGGAKLIPTRTTNIDISRHGIVSCRNDQGTTEFQIQLCRFFDPGALMSVGENLFRESMESGSPEMSNPTEHGCGELIQGYLERSNVKVSEELADLIRATQAYDAYCKVMDKLREVRSRSSTAQK